MTFKRVSLALVSAGLLSLSGASQAYVMASSMFDLSNFTIKGSNGDVLDAGDFSFLTFTTSADQDVTLSGPGGGSDDDTASSSSGSINFAPICVGNGCNPILPDDSLPKLSAPPAAGNYAAADQREEGAPITGLQGFTNPANIGQGSYVGIDTGSAIASSNANNNLNASFIFSLAQEQGVTLGFNLDAWLQVAMTADEVFPGFATSAYDLTFSVTDLSTGATVYSWSPDFFGDGTRTLSLNAPVPINLQLTRDVTNVAFADTTPVLAADTLYQLSARSNTNADAGRQTPSVPEPSILALVGLGLLGMRFCSRRTAA